MSKRERRPLVVALCETHAPLDEWETLAEVRPEPWMPGMAGGVGEPGEPVVAVRQHRGTREIRVDVYDCADGLDVTGINGGVADRDKARGQRWFRDIRTCRGGLRKLTVRLMGREAGSLELKS